MSTAEATMTAEKRTWASESGVPLNWGKPMTPAQAAFFIRIGAQGTVIDTSDDDWTLVWHTGSTTVTYTSTPIAKAA